MLKIGIVLGRNDISHVLYCSCSYVMHILYKYIVSRLFAFSGQFCTYLKLYYDSSVLHHDIWVLWSFLLTQSDSIKSVGQCKTGQYTYVYLYTKKDTRETNPFLHLNVQFSPLCETLMETKDYGLNCIIHDSPKPRFTNVRQFSNIPTHPRWINSMPLSYDPVLISPMCAQPCGLTLALIALHRDVDFPQMGNLRTQPHTPPGSGLRG